MRESVKRFIKHKILHVNDSAHRIGLGAAVGVFVAWTPLIGLHCVLALFLSFILRANKLVALGLVWISNPFTLIVIYYPSYLIGRSFLSIFRSSKLLGWDELANILGGVFSLREIFVGIWSAEFWKYLFQLFLNIGAELFAGGVIVGGFLALVSYFITYRLVKLYRKKHPHRRYRQCEC